MFEYIIKEIRPLVTCEKPSFRKLIMGLTQSNNESILPNRKQLLKELTNKYYAYISMLNDSLKQTKYLCATADIWSTNNKSFMGTILIYFNLS